MIWAARRGLSETELRELLRPADQPQLPQALWAPLRHAMEDLLVDRGGILNFAHEYLRSAVESAFVRDQDRQDTFQIQLADYFEAQSLSERNSDELPWLLWQTESFMRLRVCLLDVDRFLEIHRRDQEEPVRYWVALGEERTMGQPYLESFDSWAGRVINEETQIAFVASALAYFLTAAALYSGAEPLMRRALVIDEASYGAEHPNVAIDLNNLARLLQATNRLGEAEPLMRQMVEILLTFTHVTSHPHPHLQAAINYIGLLEAMGRRPEEISATLNVLGQPYGISLGNQA
ncbi:MAG TPA: tetratricopeptide repeat protein [Nitrospira sp.]|nr:tetratricopeptide repeat protein [Nitrospira sp.]